MTSAELRQSFLDFFTEKQHTVVASASLMPTSPNLLFTNAGMNQFVPYFLGTGAAPYDPPRASDTQKCIRAGGKHNDLEDVGYDTYHHTFFEMLGNWSFGDYFKAEAIAWAWELLVERWGLPAERLYATVYRPGEGDPAEFDQEAYDLWKGIFEKAGLDPEKHILDGGKKDNFWMMGETGPCGPCSEIHMDLTPAGDGGRDLVNQDDPRCIEIWNLVFIQYNAEEDGSFRALPACHVDTGMGFERACSVMQTTKGFTDFTELPSNYNTDVFAPLFAAIGEASGKVYGRSMPVDGQHEGHTEEVQRDIAFRVIADHLRTLSFSIADGILPGNNGRNYVLRRILRRAVRYGRTIGLGGGGERFLSGLVPALVAQMGETFPELKNREAKICSVLDQEEASFDRTLDRGMKLFDREVEALKKAGGNSGAGSIFSGDTAFKLSDTYGFPVDLTELMALEHGLKVDMDRYTYLLEEQKKRGGAKSSTVRALDVTTEVKTDFTGFDEDESHAQVVDVIEDGGKTYLIVDRCPLYAEMGGQVGDMGVLEVRDGGEEVEVLDVLKIADALALEVDKVPDAYQEGTPLNVKITLDQPRRRAIEGHHTATHLLHWALHEVVGKDVAQQGSLVAPDRLRFDFNSGALAPEQIEEVERMVNEKIAEDAPVSTREVEHGSIAEREDIMQFFGDKYGDKVRVVQVGGKPGELNGFSMELCGGTHVNRTSEIGMFKIRSEGAIAAGVRRVEAVCGEAAVLYLRETANALNEEVAMLVAKFAETGETSLALPERPADEEDIGALTAYRDALKSAAAEADKRLKKAKAAAAAKEADGKLGDLITAAEENSGGGVASIVKSFEGDGALLQEMLNGFRKRQFGGVGIVAVVDDGEGKVHLGVYVADGLTSQFQAGKIMGELAPLVGGRGGGKPDMARGAGGDVGGVVALLERAKELTKN